MTTRTTTNLRYASALAGAVLMTGAGFGSAVAAPVADQTPSRVSGTIAAITPVAAVTEAEDDASTCSRARRRLWVEGEGWIVRRVTTCR